MQAARLFTRLPDQPPSRRASPFSRLTIGNHGNGKSQLFFGRCREYLRPRFRLFLVKASLRAESSVDHQACAGDEAGFGARRVSDHPRDFLDGAVARQGHWPTCLSMSAKSPSAGFISVSTGPG